MQTQKMKVQMRKDWKIRPEAMQLEGKVFSFVQMWDITEDDSTIYVGEKAMMPVDPAYPIEAPAWIASGDLVPA